MGLGPVRDFSSDCAPSAWRESLRSVDAAPAALTAPGSAAGGASAGTVGTTSTGAGAGGGATARGARRALVKLGDLRKRETGLRETTTGPAVGLAAAPGAAVGPAGEP